jgi:hypothetical protein
MFHLTRLILHPDDACDINGLGFALQNLQAVPFLAGPGSAKRGIIASCSNYLYRTPLLGQFAILAKL